MATDNIQPSEIDSIASKLQIIRASKHIADPKSRSSLVSHILNRKNSDVDQLQCVKSIPINDVVIEPVSQMTVADNALDVRIRKLVESQAPWSQLENHCYKSLELNPSKENAAKVMEIGIMNGFADEYLAIFSRINTFVKNYYGLVHPELRKLMIRKLWIKNNHESILPYLIPLKDEQILTDIECLAVFHWATSANDPKIPFGYYQKNSKLIQHAIHTYGEEIDYNFSELNYFIGKFSMQLGFDEQARVALRNVSPKSDKYSDSLHLLTQMKPDLKDGRLDFSIENILNEKDIKNRIEALRKYLIRSQSQMERRDTSRPELNKFFLNPLNYIDDNTIHWEMLSRTIIDFRDLGEVIPSLFNVYLDNATIYQSAAHDRALWIPWVNIDAESVTEKLIRCIANIKCFVHIEIDSDRYLWEFKETFLASEFDNKGIGSAKYPDLLKSAREYISRATNMSENVRQNKLNLLKLAHDPDKISLSDVSAYMDCEDRPGHATLVEIQKIAQRKRDPSLAYQIILKRGVQGNLTNYDISQIWELSNQLNQCDLAWRAATVLRARKGLCEAVSHSWEISGEYRSQYPFVPVNLKAVETCLFGFTADEKRLARAIVTVGPLLPELLACLDDRVKKIKVSIQETGGFEDQAEKMLQNLTWLPKQKYRYRFPFDKDIGSAALPPFIKVLPANTWSYSVVRLADCLGINSWDWKITALYGQISELVPKLASRQDLQRSSSRIAKWLRKLSPEQRVAWRDLAVLARQLNDEQVQSLLAGFVFRLGTLINPNHECALKSLQEMRVDMPVIHMLENWMLCPDYTNFRQKVGIANRVLVPNSLRHKTICKNQNTYTGR